MDSKRVTEEPISSELVLVDHALGRRARAALPDPPWLVPALAELRERPPAEPVPVPALERPARAPERRRRRPRAGSVVFVVVALAFAGVTALAFIPQSHGPTLVTTAVEQAAPAAPVRPPAVTRPKTRAKPKPTQPQRPAKPKPRKARRAPVTKARTKPRAPRPASAPKPRALTRAQRMVAWRRFPAAVYYAVYLQRGAKTVFQTRTVRPRAVLPARLTVMPGTYHLVVRPAIPNDAGINLGPRIVKRTMRL